MANTKKISLQSVSYKSYTWINIENPTDREIKYLAEHYPFHPLDLDDVLSRRQRPKMDSYKAYLFYVLHFPKYRKDERVLVSSQTSYFIGENYLITVHNGELKPLTKLFRECQLDKESLKEYLENGPGFLLYSIVDRLVDYCIPIINKMMDNIEQVENQIFGGQIRGVVETISMLRRDVISFRRIIWPMRAVIGGMEAKLKNYITKEIDMTAYFGDLVDHTDKIWDALDENKEIIEGLSSTYDSMSTNRTNEVIRILTIIATVLTPITVVGSIYGMNIDTLPFADSDYSFIIVMLIIIIIVSSMLFLFRKLKVI